MRVHHYVGNGTMVDLVCPWGDGSGIIPPPTIFFHGLGSFRYVDTDETIDPAATEEPTP